MKVKKLIEELQKCNPDLEVILQSDAEGNGYSPLYSLDDNCVYEKETNWSGFVYDTNWTADEADMTEKEWKKILKKPRCVVLCPTN